MIDQRTALTDVATFITTSVGRPVGVVDMPEGATVPYAVVYPIDDVFSGPPLWDPFADVEFTFQVTSVGERWDQARWMADHVRRALLDRVNGGFIGNPGPVSGAVVANRDFVDAGGIIEGDSVVSIPERFLFHLTPS